MVATKITKDTKSKNTKLMIPLDAPPKAAACGTRSQSMNRRPIVRVHAVAIPFHTRPACTQAGPSGGHPVIRFVPLNFVVFVSFVASNLRGLDRERRR